MSKKGNENAQTNQNIFRKALIAGFFGGIFWTLVWMFLHYFHMIGVSPYIIWEKIVLGTAFDRWYTKLLGVFLNSVLSIVLAVIYFVLFKKVKHWLMGIGYGIIIWLIGYLFIPALLLNHSFLYEMETEKHVGILSLLILYGLFIGYTISFDYDHFKRHPQDH